MIEIVALLVVRGALLVAVVCAMLLTTRHRRNRSSPQARRVRSVGLWSLAAGVVALLVFWFAGE